ncbi:MAG: hypothetical protein QXU95_02720 [Candidatus Bathyarchaeia archaeon]|nr:hypothetical protein [Candidatus Bathyarchaeota archaeon]
MIVKSFGLKLKGLILVSAFCLLLTLGPYSSFTMVFSSPEPQGYIDYWFIVDEDGFTQVRIVYKNNMENGSSWMFIPRFSEWLNYTVSGRVYEWSLEEPEKYVGAEYYFYNILSFNFFSRGSQFEMVVEFNFSRAAIIIEPNGMFYSPQIGFSRGSILKASVIFPSAFRINRNEALALGASGSYRPSYLNSTFAFFENLPSSENLLRIQIGFSTPNKKAEMVSLESGIFRFETVKRYESYAQSILGLYNASYETLVNLFNVTLRFNGSADDLIVRFFIPDFNSLMSIGGYVPFSGKSMGDIYINFMFTRYVEGYLEVVALHELIHHFLWRAGVSPQNLLWFHEGIAQYVSIEIAEKLGYAGAGMIEESIEESVKDLEGMLSGNFGFLAEWTPTTTPRDFNTLYAAAYYVVSRLAGNRGLDYYARFFKIINGEKIEDSVALCYYLSLASGESVADKLNAWGFNIPDLYTYSPLLREIEKAVKDVDPISQPFKRLAESIYKMVISGGHVSAEYVLPCLLAALVVALLAPLLTLLMYSGVLFALMLFILKKKGVL